MRESLTVIQDRGTCRILSKANDKAFSRKQLTAKHQKGFSQKKEMLQDKPLIES